MFFEISPIKPEKKVKPAALETAAPEIEVLSLSPFTPNPKLCFEDVIPGQTSTRKLLVKNPTKNDITLFLSINGAPEQVLSPSWTEKTLDSGSETLFELQWTPKGVVLCRIYLVFEDYKRYKREIPVVLKTISPKKSMKGAKKKTTASPSKMPTVKYYTNKPPKVSPTKFSPKTLSKKKTKSPIKQPKTLSKTHISPKFQTQNCITPSPKRIFPFSPKHSGSPQNMIPISELPARALPVNHGQSFKHTCVEDKENSEMFTSPHNSMFWLNSPGSMPRRDTYSIKTDIEERRGTYCIKTDIVERQCTYVVNERIMDDAMFISEKHTDSPKFNDSLEGDSPLKSCNITPKIPRIVLNEYTRDNTYDDLSLSTYINRKLDEDPPQPKSPAFVFENTFREAFKENVPSYSSSNMHDCKNISSASYTKTYVDDTLINGRIMENSVPYKLLNVNDIINISSATYTKTDISLDTVASLSPHEIRYTSSPKQFGEAEYVALTRKRLSKIEEERNPIERSLKRRRDERFTSPPRKRPSTFSWLNDWSKRSGVAVRVANKTPGLNLGQFQPKTKSETTIAKTDTSTVIIKDPFLLAATNLADPFMTPQLRIDEGWIEQQQVNFKKWLNALLTPPEELSSDEKSVDVAKVWQECKTKEVQLALTKEVMSNKNYTNHKLDRIRKAAVDLYMSPEMTQVLINLHKSIDSGKISVRADKDIHLNLSLKTDIINLINNYNPLWLRIGIETIYGEEIPMRSNSDVVSLNVFIADRMLKDPNLIKKHKTVHGKTYKVELKKFFLKKFLTLVYFLDQAKNKKLIPHDPCLFRKQHIKEPVKESKELLFRLAKEVVSSIGDITKFLKYLGYVVTHRQTYIHEFDYAVQHLGVDLRDGVRLTKLMEVILLQNDLADKLRVPAISRLQKIHNVQIVFDALQQAGYNILYDITPKDIADGHKEKTLSFLWQIIYKFEAPLLVKSATTVQKWFRSLPVVLKRRHLEREKLRKESAAKKIQQWYRRQNLSKKLSDLAYKMRIYKESKERQRAAIKIQTYYRGYVCRYIYLRQKRLVTSLQSHCRGWLVRNVYKNQIRHVVVIQSYIRMYLARKQYLELKDATIFVQRRYRSLMLMREERSIFVEVRCATIALQRMFRANRVMVQERERYRQLRKYAIVIQQRLRSNKLAIAERSRYLALKSACIFVQKRFRALQLMKKERQAFLELRSATVLIQRRFRANRFMVEERERYQQLRRSAVVVQQRFRANKLAIEKREQYLTLKNTCIFVQIRFRSLLQMKKDRHAFLELISATVFIQRRFRANRLMVQERESYQQLRKAAIVIQQRFRANRLCKAGIQNYLAFRKSCVFVQRRFRALRDGRKCREKYLQMKKAAITIQSTWRGILQHRKYVHLRNAVIAIQRNFREKQRLVSTCTAIQRRFRANRLMGIERKRYLALRTSAIVIQRKVRAKLLCRDMRERFVELRQTCIFVQQRWRALRQGTIARWQYLEFRKATIIIQCTWRANVQRRRYLVMRNATITIQHWYRATALMRAKRRRYIEVREAALKIQGCYRGYLVRKRQQAFKRSIIGIQTFARGFLVRKWIAEGLEKILQQRKQVLAAVKIQASWKGFICRKRLGKKHYEIRKRVLKEGKCATTENTLGMRGQKAMTVLETDNTLYTIINALEVIDLVTRRSSKLCTDYSKTLPKLLTGIMGSINRSLPETQACIISTNIMINFYKHKDSRPFSVVPESLDAFFKIMLHFCDKECELFPSLCTLLWLYAHDANWKRVIRGVPDIEHILMKIQDLVIRKKNMLQKTTTKQKSVFVAERCKLPNLNADWGYELNNKPYKFHNSIFGFEQLLKILDY
ncbi:unnamed protein product [Acanthoscelides obtectus]|uniref:Calponin-homology (CH) domain-containing protein n=1 Tax=Acanthoscelides obtectus TaxID=200917 RepID=A0A9P0KN41_ACAOB|nr:unnamed protein product [Acanthoscelides obtectus]CAK1647390.1 Protein abnormal spindle [Acanthoscelides obtectus]